MLQGKMGNCPIICALSDQRLALVIPSASYLGGACATRPKLSLVVLERDTSKQQDFPAA
jgi:hypothetical protein